MSAKASPRHLGRQIALQVLFALDMQADMGVEQAFGHYYRSLQHDPNPDDATDADPAGGEADLDARRFAEGLVRGTWGDREAVDELISRCSRKWRLQRMTVVDRNVLRLAAHELQKRDRDVPARVAVNEAIELARRFGTTESAAFVNGVLDTLVTELGRRDEPGPPRGAAR